METDGVQHDDEAQREDEMTAVELGQAVVQVIVRFRYGQELMRSVARARKSVRFVAASESATNMKGGAT